MSAFFTLLKIIFLPVWLPFCLLRRFGGVFFALLLASFIGGCSTTSHIEKSPCACQFERINATTQGAGSNV